MRAPSRGVGRRQTTAEAFGPPLTEEEQRSNLSDLEKELNREMQCPAGKNQVYVRSLLTGSGTTRPRISLRCPLKKAIGESEQVFLPEIRDVCCNNHEGCKAWQRQQERFDAL